MNIMIVQGQGGISIRQLRLYRIVIFCMKDHLMIMF